MGELRGLDLAAVRKDALAEAREHLARANLDVAGDAGLVERQHRLAPAHGVHERGGELLARVGERLGGHAGHDGEARIADLGLGKRGAERLDRGLHQRRVERAGDVERDRAAAMVASVLLGAGEVLARAREHDLAGGVVVGDGHVAMLGDLARLVLGGADEREHRAGVVGLGHQAAAEDDELERGVAVQRAGGGQRAELAEAVAGGDAGLEAGGLVAGQARAEDRGLGEARALVSAREGVLADELDHPVEQVGRDACHEVAHLGCLAALAGKERGGRLWVGDEAHASAPWEVCARLRGDAPAEPPGWGVRRGWSGGGRATR
jgi:hypothetical protein